MTSERLSLEGNAKGTVVVATVKALRYWPGGREAVPAELRGYLERRILPSNWYPEEDYVTLLSALAPVLEANRSQIASWPKDIDVWDFIGRSSVDEYAKGPYQTLFRAGDVYGSLKNFRSFWELRHDTGKTEVVLSPQGTAAHLDLRDYAVVSKQHCKVIEGSIWGFLFYGGAEAERIQIRKAQCTADGADLCRWELAW